MSRIVNTRIKNRFDTLTNWQGTGVELLHGEIALVSVTTTQYDDAGNIVHVPSVLMKVGESNGDGTVKSFSELPWLSAKAADVYEWAKNQYAKDIPITSVSGCATGTLGAYLAQIGANAAKITELDEKIVGGVHFIGTTSTDVSRDPDKTSDTVTINGVDKQANDGDIVLLGTREFIWTGSVWEELGDVSRIGRLESQHNQFEITTNSRLLNHDADISSIQEDVSLVKENYIQVKEDLDDDGNSVYTAMVDVYEVIFDCGGASRKSVNHVESNIITFTIEGTECRGEQGMTWKQWINSDYNTVGLRIELWNNDSEYIETPTEYGGSLYNTENKDGQGPYDKIIHGASYAYYTEED